MEKQNSTRGTDDKNSKDGDFEIYLKSGLPSSQIIHLLKSQNKSQAEIDSFMDRFETSKKKINKLIKKFVEKIELKYGHLDTPELIRKGVKFAVKHGFTNAEKEAFIRFVLKGDTDTQYLPYNELAYTEMSKFLGLQSFTGQTLNIKPTDHAGLNEIARLYETTRQIHSAVRNNVVMYRDCAPDALISTFEKDKHNVNAFVHPLIVALFLPKINALEKRMLLSNFGRLVVHRSQAYFQTSGEGKNAKYLNSNLSVGDLLPSELEADLELAYDIARDPNSMNHFSEETPMSNLLKRFNIQIELWKNVLSIRQGKYYSRADSFNVDDGIMGLHKVLSTYDWTYFDSPDLYKVHDEGSMLRKLLAVFSYRPTFTQISSFFHRTGLGYSNLGAVSKATFINTPICNIKLPPNVYGGSNQPPVLLRSALTQSDLFIENKMLVPKNKSVIHSRDMIFFYVNRRHQTVNFASVDVGFRYLSLPGALSSGVTNINTTQIHFEPQIQIGNDNFILKSVVVLNPLLDGQLSTGCSSFIVQAADPMANRPTTTYFYYNPVNAGVVFEQNGKYTRNDPISVVLGNTNDPRTIGFEETARKYGTIFIYANPNA